MLRKRLIKLATSHSDHEIECMGTLRIVLLSAFVVVEQVEARFGYLAKHLSIGADQIENSSQSIQA